MEKRGQDWRKQGNNENGQIFENDLKFDLQMLKCMNVTPIWALEWDQEILAS